METKLYIIELIVINNKNDDTLCVWTIICDWFYLVENIVFLLCCVVFRELSNTMTVKNGDEWHIIEYKLLFPWHHDEAQILKHDHIK